MMAWTASRFGWARGQALAWAGKPDVDLARDVAPLVGLAKASHQFLEAGAVLGGVLEPGQEVEGLAELAAVMQAARHRGQVLKAHGDVARSLLEDLPPIVLGEVPPRIGLPDGDQRRPRCLFPAKRRLFGEELLALGASHVALVAGDAPEHPRWGGRDVSGNLDDGQM